jgi:hypothetical protein
MLVTRSLFIGAGLGALINLAAIGAAVAQQSADSTALVKPPKAKSVKPSSGLSNATAKERQALHDQVDALQRPLDAQTAAQQQTQAMADQAVAQTAAAKAQAPTAAPAALLSQKTACCSRAFGTTRSERGRSPLFQPSQGQLRETFR